MRSQAFDLENQGVNPVTNNVLPRRSGPLSLVVCDADGVAAANEILNSAALNLGAGSVAPLKRPRVLVVTFARERFIDLRQCDIEWAQDHLSATAAAITTAFDAIVCDVVIGADANESGYEFVSSIRSQQRLICPIYLVADQPLPSDTQNAVRAGATDLLLRYTRRISRVLQGVIPQWTAPVEIAREPSWLAQVIGLAQAVLASEAEPRTRAIYVTLVQRSRTRQIEVCDVIGEVARLIDTQREREMFLRQATRR
jgi:CheY-like chemotaxis protein